MKQKRPAQVAQDLKLSSPEQAALLDAARPCGQRAPSCTRPGWERIEGRTS